MFAKAPNSLQFILWIVGLVLIIFATLKIGDIARNGQNYFKKADPAVTQILQNSNPPFPSTIEITQSQILNLAEAKSSDPPSTNLQVSTLNLLFLLGIFLISNTQPHWPKDKSTFPND